MVSGSSGSNDADTPKDKTLEERDAGRVDSVLDSMVSFRRVNVKKESNSNFRLL